MNIFPFESYLPNTDLIASPDSFSSDVKVNFKEFIATNMCVREDEPAFYVYRIIDDGHIHTGIVTATDIQDYRSGKIKPHEKTISGREQEHLQLVLKLNATTKPILLVYPEVSSISELIRRIADSQVPDVAMTFEKSQQVHQFWKVTDKTWVKKMTTLFSKYVGSAFIADGHHRMAATSTLQEKFPDMHYGKAFTAYFSFSEVDILPYNRVVKDLNGLTPTHLIARLSRYFKIKPLNHPILPKKKHQMLFLMNHEWYRLTWRKPFLKRVDGMDPLDSHLLNTFIFKPILGIEDPRLDKRIAYVGGDKGLEGLVRKVGDEASHIGFFLYPVDLQDMVDLSDNGRTLPPKSTWFEPRLKNGLIVREFL